MTEPALNPYLSGGAEGSWRNEAASCNPDGAACGRTAGTEPLLEGRYFPLGFPLRLLSNHPGVLRAAQESWSRFRPAFPCAPLELRMVVLPGTRRGIPPAPVFRVSDHRLVNCAGEMNTVIADLDSGRAAGRITEGTVKASSYLRYHLLEAAALSMVATLRAVPIHAACVGWGSGAALLCGDSGAGKSSLAYACARGGFTFVSDDATYLPLHREDRLVTGNCYQIRFRPAAAELFPELAGRPQTPRAAGKPSVEVALAEWPELAFADRATVRCIVFLDRSQGDRHELLPLCPAAAAPWFRRTMLCTERTRPVLEAALDRLLQVPVYELRYSNLRWAVEQVRGILKESRQVCDRLI